MTIPILPNHSSLMLIIITSFYLNECFADKVGPYQAVFCNHPPSAHSGLWWEIAGGQAQ